MWLSPRRSSGRTVDGACRLRDCGTFSAPSALEVPVTMADAPVSAVRSPVPQPRDPDDADSPAGKKRTKARIRQPLRHRLRRDRALLLFCLPGVLYFVLFFYLPLAGNVIAFQDYQPFLGFKQSPFVGLANFTTLLSE